MTGSARRTEPVARTILLRRAEPVRAGGPALQVTWRGQDRAELPIALSAIASCGFRRMKYLLHERENFRHPSRMIDTGHGVQELGEFAKDRCIVVEIYSHNLTGSSSETS